MPIIDVRSYTVKPAVNGWMIEFRDERTGSTFTQIYGTSAQVAKFFHSLDAGRKAARKQLVAARKKK